MNKQEQLKEMVREYNLKVAELEQVLVDFALEHELKLYLGDYGNGRTLLLKDNDEGGWNDKKRGEWLYSSETC